MGIRRGLAAAAVIAGLMAALPGIASAAPSPAPLKGSGSGLAIAGRYIVVLKQGTASAPDVLRSLLRQSRVAHEYHGALRGFAASLHTAQLTAVRADPQVAYVEADQVVRTDVAQNNATWGLDRIDQRALPANRVYNFTAAGWGVRAYVIDTGIYARNVDFGNRVAVGYSAISDGRGTADCNGHGTHVAGTIGSNTYGVAKLTLLIPVRVLDCNGAGSISGVIAGVDWVTANRLFAPGSSITSTWNTSATATATLSGTSMATPHVTGAAALYLEKHLTASPAAVASALTAAATPNVVSGAGTGSPNRLLYSLVP